MQCIFKYISEFSFYWSVIFTLSLVIVIIYEYITKDNRYSILNSIINAIITFMILSVFAFFTFVTVNYCIIFKK